MKKEKETEKTIRLTMTEDDAKLVAKACEFYARIKIGQFKEIIWNFLDIKLPTDDYCLRQEKLEDLLYQARAVLYPDLGKHIGTSYGYGKFEDADQAFDVYQLLRIAYGVNQYPLLTKPYPDLEKRIGEKWEKLSFNLNGMSWK